MCRIVYVDSSVPCRLTDMITPHEIWRFSVQRIYSGFKFNEVGILLKETSHYLRLYGRHTDLAHTFYTCLLCHNCWRMYSPQNSQLFRVNRDGCHMGGGGVMISLINYIYIADFVSLGNICLWINDSWCNDVLFDVMTYFSYIYILFDDVFLDVTTFLLMSHDVLFDVMTYILTSRRTFWLNDIDLRKYVMIYFFMQWCTFFLACVCPFPPQRNKHMNRKALLM